MCNVWIVWLTSVQGVLQPLGFSKIQPNHQQGAVEGHRCFCYSLIHLNLPLGKLLAFEIHFKCFCDFHHCCWDVIYTPFSTVPHICWWSSSVHIHAGEVSSGPLSPTPAQLQHLLSDGWRPLTWGEQHPLPQQCPGSQVGVRYVLIVSSIPGGEVCIHC